VSTDVGQPDKVKILRDNDPRCDALKDAGWRIVSTSWGGRLQLREDDIPRLGGSSNEQKGSGIRL